ncbi:NAD-dependent epimerase/dehydratase family protein [Aureimonas sp. ME7]|uniref:NAD-dependent epimerase/dehydratase family protein n=1 Tax=Aureimonas sp. ME7 TaxID=2744252 RepID=UPI0015F720F9|nr:NAD-dependent epimerase/dehydratase family protein [Aureimonas sp. ME7]
MRILITGSTGFVGRTLVPHLAGLGHEVVALRRGENGVPFDLARIGEWTGWPDGVEAVIHLGALNPVRSDPAARDDAALMAANASGTGALAKLAADRGVKRFVYASTNLIHPLSAEPFDERAPHRPQNLYAASKLAGEEAMARALEGSGTEGTILRLPPIYGPGGRGGVSTLLRVASFPVPLPLASPSASRSLLSIANAASALAHAALAPEAAGGTFLVADGEPWSLGEIVAFARQEAGRAPRLFSLPTGFTAEVARLMNRSAQYEHVFGSLVVDDAAFRARLGWRPIETTEEGMRRTLREQRANAARTTR